MVVAFMTPLSGFWILLIMSPDVIQMFVKLSSASDKKALRAVPEDQRPLRPNEAMVVHETEPMAAAPTLRSAMGARTDTSGQVGVPTLRSAVMPAAKAFALPQSLTKLVKGKKVRVYHNGTQLRGSARAYDNAFEMTQASVIRHEASLARREQESQRKTGMC
jgi:hypothetical protein